MGSRRMDMGRGYVVTLAVFNVILLPADNLVFKAQQCSTFSEGAAGELNRNM